MVMTAEREAMTLERVREILDYDPATGVLRWKTSRGARSAGAEAGYVKYTGYRCIQIAGKGYFAHRIAWLLNFGEWPVNQVDHRNGDRSDNRIVNLRQATNAENQQNQSRGGKSASGYLGVNWHPVNHKWHARIKVNGRTKHLGYFDDPVRAAAAYRDAKTRLHKFQPVPRS